VAAEPRPRARAASRRAAPRRGLTSAVTRRVTAATPMLEPRPNPTLRCRAIVCTLAREARAARDRNRLVARRTVDDDELDARDVAVDRGQQGFELGRRVCGVTVTIASVSEATSGIALPEAIYWDMRRRVDPAMLSGPLT